MTAAMIELDDGAQLRTWTAGSVIPQRLPVVMVHGGPGVPDYLAPVADIISDLRLVHRDDQRGTAGSSWEGEHTIARHVHDLALLLDAWGHDRVVLVAHSFGTNLASYFLLAHPERVAGLVQIAGPFWIRGGKPTEQHGEHGALMSSRPSSTEVAPGSGRWHQPARCDPSTTR